MSVSKTSLCNLALSRVGEQTIQSLDEESKNAQMCNLIYDEVLEQVLREYIWKCAMFRKTLIEDATTPAFGWSHQYILPNDPKCLFVVRMEDPKSVFTVENNRLLTEESVAKILYVGFLDDPSAMTPLFRKVFYLSMAVEMAYRLVQNNTILNGLTELLEQAWREARSRDSQEGTPMATDESSWISARYQGLGYGIDITTAR